MTRFLLGMTYAGMTSSCPFALNPTSFLGVFFLPYNGLGVSDASCTVRKLILKPTSFWRVFLRYNGLRVSDASCGGPLPGYGS